MKMCNECGIIVHDEFKECPSCKSISFTPCEEEVVSKNVKTNNDESIQTSNSLESKLFNGVSSNQMVVFRVLEILGGVLSVFGLFLPFIQATILGTTFKKAFYELAPDDVFIFITIGGLGFICACIGIHIFTAILGGVYGVVLLVDTYDYFAQIRQSDVGSIATKGIGFYCMVVGLVLMAVFGAVSAYLKLNK